MMGFCEECGEYSDLYRDRRTGLYLCSDCADYESDINDEPEGDIYDDD